MELALIHDHLRGSRSALHIPERLAAMVVDVIVLGILPLSVVAPFAGLTIVFSLLLARTTCMCTSSGDEHTLCVFGTNEEAQRRERRAHLVGNIQ